MGEKAFSIVVPNYNGAELLKEYLPSILDAAESYSDPYEVIVVDDGSTDHGIDLLHNKYPTVRILVNDRNVGFGESINRGVTSSTNRIVVLLNNDVRVEKDFFPPILSHFSKEHVFGVVARGLIIHDEVVKNESVTRFEFKDGFLNLVQPGLLNPEARFDEVCTVAHACGGFSAFDREKFLALGGFDNLYYPFYWEDVDICYRAWKRGWWTLYEPNSIAHHRCHATIGQSRKRDYIAMLHVRNKLLFTWKNVIDTEMIIEHLRALNIYVKSAPEHFKQGFFEALKKIDDVLQRRIASRKEEKYSDRDVIDLSANRPIG